MDYGIEGINLNSSNQAKLSNLPQHSTAFQEAPEGEGGASLCF